MTNKLLVNTEVALADGDALSLEMVRMRNELTIAKAVQGETHFYKSVKDMGITGKVTLLSIAKRMRRRSVLIVSVYGGTSDGPDLPLPYFNSGTPAYMSGILWAYKMEDEKKVYFEWRNENMTARCNYNEHVEDKVTPWVFDMLPKMNATAGPGYWQNRMSNIWVPGTYYFTRDQMNGFTDRPVLGGGYLEVMNAGNSPTSDRNYVFTLNTSDQHKWSRQNDGDWRIIPVCFTAAVPDSQMRVGDMKVASNGMLHIRVSSSKVGQIATVG